MCFMGTKLQILVHSAKSKALFPYSGGHVLTVCADPLSVATIHERYHIIYWHHFSIFSTPSCAIRSSSSVRSTIPSVQKESSIPAFLIAVKRLS